MFPGLHKTLLYNLPALYAIMMRVAQPPSSNPGSLELTGYCAKRDEAGKQQAQSFKELSMPDDVLMDDVIRQKLVSKRHSVLKLGRYDVTIDGQRSFRRDGSDKLPKGWQITIEPIP